MRFIWDESKNRRNRKRHGVSFEEASTLFAQGNQYLDIFDEAHSFDEDRFIAIGSIAGGIVLVVYTEEDDDVVRIISARFATKREAEMYRSYVGGGSR